MSNTVNLHTESEEHIVYQIRCHGHLGAQWTDWFNGLSMKQEKNGDTLLIGHWTDQAELYGVLKKVRDLGMPLLSVNRLNFSLKDAPDVKL
jgi:hypothetical protein